MIYRVFVLVFDGCLSLPGTAYKDAVFRIILIEIFLMEMNFFRVNTAFPADSAVHQRRAACCVYLES